MPALRGRPVVVSSRPLPPFAECSPVGPAGAWYVHGPASLTDSLAHRETAVVDVATHAVRAGPVDASSWRTVLGLGGDRLDVVVGAMNDEPLYLVRTDDEVAVTDDLLAAVAVLRALGLPVEVLADAVVGPGEGAPVRHVTRLSHCSRHAFVRDAGGALRHDLTRLPDPLAAPRPRERTGDDGTALLDALGGALERGIAGRSAGVLLSGGVDSATVAALAARVAPGITAYGVGTPWGDEFADAREVADALGIAFVPVSYDEETLLGGLAGAIRWLGHWDAETVEIALAISLVLGDVADLPEVMCTGYGSDLLLGGLLRGDPEPAEVVAHIQAGVERTRWSNEFTATAARATGRTLLHPYWDERVVDAALRFAPHALFREGREKYVLRRAAESLLPPTAAWREKRAIHHGGSLQSGLRDRIARDTGRPDAVADVYREVFLGLVDLDLAGLDEIDGLALYGQAVDRVATPAAAAG